MVAIQESNLISISKEREAIYTFLRVSLQCPLTIEILQHWKNHLSFEFKSILSEGNKELGSFFESLDRKKLETIIEEEKEAYLATFYVFNEEGKVPAPPWESAYVTRDKSLFGEPVFQIRKRLADFGLQYIHENTDPDDHIAIELEFMNFLINYTLSAKEEGRDDEYAKGVYTQYWLMKEHLNRWITPFTKDILSSNTSPFYKGIALLLSLFVEEDFEYIKTIKEDLDNE
ncbi:TorD/DmsD family molecular chaperone [Bacillus massiliigorillae]|uniref:TorD/DmsD family molecular chaperone n=1 Tax=Bacillus massiliigorillae TaxID=1243664 RepID=UPI00039CFCEB|nr:molecular chaperone TorD family protein [Bacillus massiliigorillae]